MENIIMQNETCADVSTITPSHKYDYILSACCGVLAGITDIVFVGDPESSKLGKAVDQSADSFIEKAAQFFWKADKRDSGKPKKMPDTLEKCISYLEQAFPVNYDARYAKDLLVEDGILSGMTPKNHHLLSLAHSPDIIGFVFSVIDQFSSDGSASFVNQGKVIHVVPKKTSGAIPYLQGSDITSKLFCGFINWIGHMISDIGGSSSTRKEGKTGRGMGIPMPFYEAFLFSDLKFRNGEDLAETMIAVYESGYDLRFGITSSIPIIIEELMIRSIWAIRRFFIFQKPWKECIPIAGKENPDLRTMLLLGNGVFCLIDGVDAAIHGIKAKNWVTGICHLNMAGWTRLTILAIKEVTIRTGLFIEDNKDQFYETVFGKLSSIDQDAIIRFEMMIKKIAESTDVIKTIKDSLQDLSLAREERLRIEAECEERILEIVSYRNRMEAMVEDYLSSYMVAFGCGMELIENGLLENDSNNVIAGSIVIQKKLGKDEQFSDQDEFDDLMLSDDSFKL